MAKSPQKREAKKKPKKVPGVSKRGPKGAPGSAPTYPAV